MPLGESQIEKLGLEDFIAQWSSILQRDVNIMLFADVVSAVRDAPSMKVSH